VPSRTVSLPDPEILKDLGEFFASGYFELPGGSPMLRWSRAVRRRWENEPPGCYTGGMIHPCGPKGHDRSDIRQNRILRPDFSFTWTYQDDLIDSCLKDATEPQRETLLALRNVMRGECDRLSVFTIPHVVDGAEELFGRYPSDLGFTTPHVVGGAGFTHSIPNYTRVLTEGLEEHARRIEIGLEQAHRHGDRQRIEFYLGLQDVLTGIRCWHSHMIEHLRSWSSDDPTALERRDRVLEALRHVPFKPAGTFYEAVLAYNLIFYLDDADNLGRIDQVLYPYYKKDCREGRLDREGALKLLREFLGNVDKAAALGTSAIGGTNIDGEAGYNEMTVMCMEASHGNVTPTLELRVRKDMPDELWQAAFDSLLSGNGQPCFYNEEGYLNSLRQYDLGLTEQDITLWNGGGCTETMIHGCSNVGSIDAGINLPLVLESTLNRHLADARSFDAFIAAFKRDIAETIRDIVENVNRDQQCRAQHRPQPMRSLLIDDCIDRGLEFNAGGARYNWSVVNMAGLSNVADSLAAIKQVVFETREKTAAQLLDILETNFAGQEEFRRRLKRCPRFGNDCPEVDDIAVEIAESVFAEYRRYAPWRGGRFLPACIMFAVYGWAGAQVGATPDGRLAGEPLADSIGPYQGRDVNGPTAMLNSVTKLPLSLAVGTPVLNIRLGKQLLTEPPLRPKLRALIEAYFARGGMQIQINIVDQETLKDAIEHPERHEDLIVRIGGYSVRFNNLSEDLKLSLLERTVHG